MAANYWDYATGSNSIPDGLDFNGDPVFDAVFSEIINASNQNHPNGVTNAGVVSPYGTFGQNGNVFEWEESAFDGVNDSSTENRVARGGAWVASDDVLRASSRGTGVPAAEFNAIGFRVASIPEPSCTMLMLSAGLAGLLGKRRTARR